MCKIPQSRPSPVGLIMDACRCSEFGCSCRTADSDNSGLAACAAAETLERDSFRQGKAVQVDSPIRLTLG